MCIHKEDVKIDDCKDCFIYKHNPDPSQIISDTSCEICERNLTLYKEAFNPELYKNKIKPYECPVCHGAGKRPNGHEDGEIVWDKCHPCNSTGIVWG